jgi:hypothetical protein
MFVSQHLKQKNIAEYLIYMWQVEDLIRANNLDIEKLKEGIINQYQVGDEDKQRLTQWYEDLIEMMRREDVIEKGHLQINKNVLISLTELHQNLLRSPKEPFYGTSYYKALPYIVELRAKGGKTDEPELETCFEALYGMMLLRLSKKEISEATSKAIAEISKFISLLANYYEKEKNGELKLDE